MATTRAGRTGWIAGLTAATLALISLSAAQPSAADASGAAAARTAASPAAAPRVPAPVSRGRLRIAGQLRDGATVAASGLSWHAPRLHAGDTLLSFEVAYTWQRCSVRTHHCVTASDSTVTPFAAARYTVGHGDTGSRLRLTETAAEVVETSPATFSFRVVRRSASLLTKAAVRAYPAHQRPRARFVDGTPEHRTASAEEYFHVSAPHYNRADGTPAQQYRTDQGRWRPLPGNHALYTAKLRPGLHRVAVRTSNRAGSSTIRFRWHVVPLPRPQPCQASAFSPQCWYPPHLASDHHPMRWDWQIGLVTPLQRTGKRAVDLYDIDGFLTTPAKVKAIHTSWQARTLAHPRAVCYLDLAWEDYRPDASPGGPGSNFPAATLGNVYYGFPQERWVDFRQLTALKPMLRERIAMCAKKGFDAVELDDIDSFDPPSTTGFLLTPGDVQNFLAYAFNEIHHYGMTGLWKNSPLLSWWGRKYTDGAVVEECYSGHACFASSLRGSHSEGLTCTALSGRTPCGWDDFTTDATRHQPNGKWVGEAEYGSDHYVCNPGQHCQGPHTYAAFCRAVYAPSSGFAAVKFDSDLNGKTFFPCPRGQ